MELLSLLKFPIFIGLIRIYLDAYNTAHSYSYVSTTKLGSSSTVVYTCFPEFLSSMHTGEYWHCQIRRKCTNLIFPHINFFRIIPCGITNFQWLCVYIATSVVNQLNFWDFIILESYWLEYQDAGQMDGMYDTSKKIIS